MEFLMKLPGYQPKKQIISKGYLPTDTGFAIAQTEVRLTYTATTLYMAITCFDPTPGKTAC